MVISFLGIIAGFGISVFELSKVGYIGLHPLLRFDFPIRTEFPFWESSRIKKGQLE